MPHFYTLRTRLLLSLSFLLFLSLFGLTKSWGQTYATSQSTATWQVNNVLSIWGSPFTSTAYASIMGANNVVNANNSTPAVMTAKSTNILIGGSRGYSILRLSFASAISANKTAYIRIDQPVASGISLSLLQIIGDLTNLITDNIVYGKAYETTASTTAISNTTSALVKDVNGNLYLAVTSPNSFQSVEIYLDYSTQLLALNLGATLTMNVYYAAADYPDNSCGNAIFSDLGSVSGISVALTSAVQNPENALKGNGTSYSTIGGGLGQVLGVASTIAQTLYFPQTVNTGQQVKLDLQMPGSLLNLTVLNNISVQAYNGTTAVGIVSGSNSGPSSLGSLIRLDLLGLFAQGPKSIYFTPTGNFNKIVFSVGPSLATVSLGTGIFLFGAHTVPPTPTVSVARANMYTGNTPNINVTNSTSGSTITWYNPLPSLTSIGTGTSFPTNYSGPSDTLYAVATTTGCTVPSDSAKFYINVLTATSTGTVSSPYTITPNQTSRPKLALATSGDYTGLTTPPTFTYSNITGIDPAATSGLTINPNGTITGDPLVKTTYTVQATAYDQSNSLPVGIQTFSLYVPFILPIQYDQPLTASYTNGAVTLDWATATEINNSYFDVQRSPDNQTWSSITHVKSFFTTGTGSGHAYEYVDKTITGGPYYYRLVQNDLDGKKAISDVVSINIGYGNTSSGVIVYPNPVQSSFKLQNCPANSSYRLFSMSGQVLKTGTVNNASQDINITDISAGLYLLEVSQNGSTIAKLKLIKR